MNFTDFLERFAKWGAEYFRRYYGPYRAIVVSASDPAARGRVQVECPRARLSESNGIWVEPMMQGAGSGKGMFWPPEKGEAVWIFFDNGDPLRPIGYVGGWYGSGEVPVALRPDPDKEPDKRGFVTPGGISVVLDDANKQVTIKLGSGNQVKITEDSIMVGSEDGSYEPMVRGSTMKLWCDTHTHGHSMGPTGPTLQQLPDDALSDLTKTG